MDRYQFLSGLHQIIKPDIYLEIGVQTGASLVLAKDATMAIGVDPEFIHLQVQPANAYLFECTSDAFFEELPVFTGSDGKSRLDLVFIDGLHHSEQVFRDLLNAAKHGHSGTVYVLDDVLPRNQAEAGRDMIPGDWTGDVWKVIDAIEGVLNDDDSNAAMMLVDTFPTGVAVIQGGLDTALMEQVLGNWTNFFTSDREVPHHILHRIGAYAPDSALKEIEQWMTL